MARYKLKDGEQVRTRICAIASGTVVEAGDLVAIDGSGLIIKAVAASAKVAFTPGGSASGETTIEVTVGNDFTLEGTSDDNYAVTDQGILCDIIDTTQLIDIATSSTDVLQVGLGQDAGTAGSTASVEVKINKPIF